MTDPAGSQGAAPALAALADAHKQTGEQLAQHFALLSEAGMLAEVKQLLGASGLQDAVAVLAVAKDAISDPLIKTGVANLVHLAQGTPGRIDLRLRVIAQEAEPKAE